MSGSNGERPGRTLLPVLSPGAGATGHKDATGPAPRVTDGPRYAVVQTTWARVLMDSLRRAGADRAVISPGSRSTPFALAAEHVGMITETIIDERSAGFFALGYARASNRPVVLVCTSGSAGAHYYPAVIEAAQAHIPLIVLTADRPPELHGCAAPQTIDQTRLFGHFARAFVNLGLPEASRTSLRALCRRAAQAVFDARYPQPGPVHINACARKPLEPQAPEGAAEIAIVERSEDVLRAFSPRAAGPVAIADDGTIDSLTRACIAASRGVIVAGPAAPGRSAGSEHAVQAAYALARATGYPLLCESASQLRFAADPDGDDPGSGRLTLIDGFDLLCDDPGFASQVQPELIIQIGTPPISGAWARYLQSNLECVHCVIGEGAWPDPQASVDLLIAADPADTLGQLAAGVAEHMAELPDAMHARRSWADLWSDANQLTWQIVEETLTRSDDPMPLREGQVMAAAIAAVPAHSFLLLGNSLPVRTADTYARRRPSSVHVLTQRGASGIDGWLAAAAGTAWVHGARYASAPARATVAIIGDVTCNHDIGSLTVAARADAPLCIVVIDNGGGRIFELLPIAEATYGTSKAVFEKHFLTPPACDLAGTAQAFGAAYRRIASVDELSVAIEQACSADGCTLVHVPVVPESARADRARIRDRLRSHFEAAAPAEGA